MSAEEINPFAAPQPLTDKRENAQSGEPPLAVYLGRLSYDRDQRVELFARRLKVVTSSAEVVLLTQMADLAALRAQPQLFWMRRGPASIFPGLVSLFCFMATIELIRPGRPLHHLGGVLACLLASCLLSYGAYRLGPLCFPQVERAVFVDLRGLPAVVFEERTASDPNFAAFVARVQEQIDATAALGFDDGAAAKK